MTELDFKRKAADLEWVIDTTVKHVTDMQTEALKLPPDANRAVLVTVLTSIVSMLTVHQRNPVDYER